jgi:hypothetical protein
MPVIHGFVNNFLARYDNLHQLFDQETRGFIDSLSESFTACLNLVECRFYQGIRDVAQYQPLEGAL